jgi:hypothetical protein
VQQAFVIPERLSRKGVVEKTSMDCAMRHLSTLESYIPTLTPYHQTLQHPAFKQEADGSDESADRSSTKKGVSNIPLSVAGNNSDKSARA